MSLPALVVRHAAGRIAHRTACGVQDVLLVWSGDEVTCARCRKVLDRREQVLRLLGGGLGGKGLR